MQPRIARCRAYANERIDDTGSRRGAWPGFCAHVVDHRVDRGMRDRPWAPGCAARAVRGRCVRGAAGVWRRLAQPASRTHSSFGAGAAFGIDAHAPPAPGHYGTQPAESDLACNPRWSVLADGVSRHSSAADIEATAGSCCAPGADGVADGARGRAWQLLGLPDPR